MTADLLEDPALSVSRIESQATCKLTPFGTGSTVWRVGKRSAARPAPRCSVEVSRSREASTPGRPIEMSKIGLLASRQSE